jgi:hypothetical protein
MMFGEAPELLILIQPGIRLPFERKVAFPATFSETVRVVVMRFVGVLDTTKFVIWDSNPAKTLTDSDAVPEP